MGKILVRVADNMTITEKKQNDIKSYKKNHKRLVPLSHSKKH